MTENIAALEKRHKQEVRDLEGKVRALLKTAKKATKAVVEAEAIQMGYDLKAKQNEEYELASSMEDLTIEVDTSITIGHTSAKAEAEIERRIEEETAAAKKAKSQKKKDKKVTKGEERLLKKEEINSSAGPSLREVELTLINDLLFKQDLVVKVVAADGHCLYRAIADQLNSLWLHLPPHSQSSTTGSESEEFVHDFITLRTLASTYLRSHSDEFAPFLGMIPNDTEYIDYCNKVESVGDAEWGGQLEIKALCSSLKRTMMIYSADAPVIIMGDEYHNLNNLPLKLAYHRHFYALGEHYNSIAPIVKPCACCKDHDHSMKEET